MVKRKKLKKVIHSFVDSFQSFDDDIDENVLLTEICKLKKNKGISFIEVDFIKKKIQPAEAKTNEIKMLVLDYCDWLPELCISNGTEFSMIKELEVKVDYDFDSPVIYKASRDEQVIQVITTYRYVDNRGIDHVGTITSNEVVKIHSFSDLPDDTSIL